MKQWIQHWDLRVIQHLQERWSSSMMDTIMLFARNPYTWSPLYLFLAGWMWMRFGRKGLRWCLFFLLTFAISDFVGARLLKPFVHRIRPCMDTDVGPFIRHVVACGSGYSFPSVHACNHFALAAFMTGTLQRLYPATAPLVFAWALLVSLAQVYVGVHYPSDVLGGACIGCLIGWITALIFQIYAAWQSTAVQAEPLSGKAL